MCGIAGIISQNSDIVADFLELSGTAQYNRGPDNQSIVTINPFFGFSHQRLSIIDPTPASNQPFSVGSNWLCYNGEIYNYKDLASEHLISDLNDSDTATLAFLLAQDPLRSLDNVQGFYAFSYYDSQRATLRLSVDPFGIKSIYYYQSEGLFLWASDYKFLFEFVNSISRPLAIRPDALDEIYTYLSPFAQLTLHQQILRLRPGQDFVVSPAKLLAGEKYVCHNRFLSIEALASNRNDVNSSILSSSIERSFVSDVPVANSLSGGLDSSYIALQSKLCSSSCYQFHITKKTSKEKFVSDTGFARQVVSSFNLAFYELDSPDLTDQSALSHIFQVMHVPGDVSAALPLSSICEHIKLTKEIRVLFVGLGADEIFHGYRAHRLVTILQFLDKFPFAINLASVFLQFLQKFSKSDVFSRRIFLARQSLHQFSKGFISSPFEWGTPSYELRSSFCSHYKSMSSSSSPFERLCSTFFYHFLAANHLSVCDSVSMASSVEVRPSFLQPSLISRRTFVSKLSDLIATKKLISLPLKEFFWSKICL